MVGPLLLAVGTLTALSSELRNGFTLKMVKRIYIKMDSGYSGYSGWPILWARVFLFEKGKVLTKSVPYFFVVDPMNYPDTLVAR